MSGEVPHIEKMLNDQRELMNMAINDVVYEVNRLRYKSVTFYLAQKTYKDLLAIMENSFEVKERSYDIIESIGQLVKVLNNYDELQLPNLDHSNYPYQQDITMTERS